jgi:hypothetical protein
VGVNRTWRASAIIVADGLAAWMTQSLPEIYAQT